jgi:uncharacterized protein
MIDFHTHPIMIKELIEKDPALGDHIRDILGFYFPPQPLSVVLSEMDAAGIDQCVLLPLDCSSTHHCKIPSNETIATLCETFDRFIGFASVDPNIPSAAKDLEHAFKQMGLSGLYLDPAVQRFEIDAKEKTHPLFQTCLKYNRPVLFQCGINWSPQSSLKLANPLLLEETAQGFPDLKLVISNFGWPWFREAIMLAMKYRNVYLDTSLMYSGTPREMFTHLIGCQIEKGVFERNLFFQTVYGSNFPRVDMRRTMRGMQSVGFSTEFKEQLFIKNAQTLLNLQGQA